MEKEEAPIADEQTEQIDSSLYVGILDRVKSSFIDGMILIGLMYGFTLIFDSMNEVPIKMKAIAYFSLFFYDPLMIGLSGATIGHRLMKIKVVNSKEESSRISIGAAFIRSAAKLLLGWVSLLTISFNPKHKAIHDQFVDSVVMYTHPD